MSKSQSDEEIDKIIRQSIEFYARNYELKTWTVGRGQKRIVLGKDEIRRCRFCSRASPEVSFRHEAHAIPESLGNNNLFTKYECDDCNQKFGDTIENDFANWLLPVRTIAGIRGKKKYPTVKSKDGKSRLDSSRDGLNVDHHSDDDFFVPDEESKTLKFNLSVPPYRPIGVWKALIKMGISLIDDSRIGHFENTIKWLMDDPSHRPIRLWPIQSYTIPGSGRSDNLSVAMLYRNSDYIRLPYAMMFILYGLQSFQVIIPSFSKDFAVPSPELDLPILSLFDVDSIRRYGIPQLRQLNLSGTEIVKDDTVTIHGTFDNREKVDTSSDGPSESQPADA